jgi:hypothetical protein
MIKYFTVAVLAFTFVSSSLFAQEIGTPEFDTGKPEAKQHRMRNFQKRQRKEIPSVEDVVKKIMEKHDVNKDGVLSPAELTSAIKARRAMHQNRMQNMMQKRKEMHQKRMQKQEEK